MAKKLYRSTQDRIIGGVCSGLADYFDIDVTLVRILWAIFAFAHGVGVLAYLVAWIIVPEAPGERDADEVERDPEEKPAGSERPYSGSNLVPAGEQRDGGKRPRDDTARFLGITLILVGAWFLARNFIPWIDLGNLWPILLIAAGLALLFAGVRGR